MDRAIGFYPIDVGSIPAGSIKRGFTMWLFHSIIDSLSYYRNRISFMLGIKESSCRKTDEIYYSPIENDWEGNDD